MASPAKQRPNFEVELQAIEDYRRFAALTIQRYYRGWIVRLHKARKEAARQEREQSAAAQQAEAARLYKAARAIQDGWRSYRNKRIYRFYRDLIKFREAAEPRQLLRSINAPEAALVDPAAGLHIRFRLGGSTFPPILLYKVFTHRPVTDICAFGPRNYAAEAAAAKPAAPTAAAPPPAPAGKPSSSSNSKICVASRSDWYCRDDRNGWRPVVELQQQRDSHQQGTYAGSSSSRRGRHRGTQMRQRRTRLQLAHGSSSAGKAFAAAGKAGGAESGVLEGGYNSEPEFERERSGSAGAAFLHRKQPQQFHHSPLVRRAERAQKLKQRRRQWLLKLYRTGMQAAAGAAGTMGRPNPQQQPSETPTAAGAGGHQLCTQQQQQQHQQHQQVQVQQAQPVPGSTDAVPPCDRCSSEERLLQQLEQQLALSLDAAASGAASGSSSAVQQAAGAGGEDSVGWEDPEDLLLLGLDAGILAWAQKLDFDSYQQQWSSTAVTLGSEVAVPQSERLLLQQLG